MQNLDLVIATLGALLLLGLLGDLLARQLAMPRVTLLVLFGLVAGRSGLELLPRSAEDWYPLVSNIALLIVGFLLGGRLSIGAMRAVGRPVLAISVSVAVGSGLVVLGGLLLAGFPLALALLLAGIAPATDPAAVTNVAKEAKAEGPFTDILLGVVAIDDAWGLIVFALTMAAVQAVSGEAGAIDALLHGGRELGGAILIGAVIGVPAAYLTGRLRPGEPMQAEALGVVLLAGGVALWIGASFLLTAMVLGAVIVNLAKHHDRPFHEISHIEWPFMVLFFILAGATLRLEDLVAIGWIGALYVMLRIGGRFVGAYAGGALGGVERRFRPWMGLAIMPQAGVALGMALIAGNAFPELRGTILPLVIGSTVVFELAGPVFTRLAITRAGEARASDGETD